jgi:hypothetical protein
LAALRAAVPSVVGREGADRSTTKVYLVGGGIASLAAAAFMVRDSDVLGHNITIFAELDKIGGSLDGSGSPETGYVLRGGRMIKSKYVQYRVQRGTQPHNLREEIAGHVALESSARVRPER